MEIEMDLSKIDREYYNASDTPSFEVFGRKRYIAVDGKGAPGGKTYQSRIEMMFTIAQQIRKEAMKNGRNFVVSNLECLWWTDDDMEMRDVPQDQWQWRLMIRIPDIVIHRDIEDAKREIFSSMAMVEVKDVRVARMNEGKCVQVMHTGPYEAIGETYGKMLSFIEGEGLRANGKFHEIYLSDPSRTSQDELRTIVRVPVTRF